MKSYGQETDNKHDIQMPVSINALMVTLIDHSAHYIWDYAYVTDSRALTDKEWQIVEYYSVQLAAAGPLLTLGGTGNMDGVWAANSEWRKWAQQMTDIAASAMQAARAKNVAGLVKANNDLVSVCEGCHDTFKPETPTEGIMHDPQYDHLYHLLSPKKD